MCPELGCDMPFWKIFSESHYSSSHPGVNIPKEVTITTAEREGSTEAEISCRIPDYQVEQKSTEIEIQADTEEVTPLIHRNLFVSISLIDVLFHVCYSAYG